MEDEGIYNSLCCFFLYFLLTGIACQDSLTPGPVAFVINDSNVTFTCSTTNRWNVIYFYDNGVQASNLARVIFQGNNTHCRHLYTDPRYGADKYTPLPCYVGQPVSIIVRHINSSYHNKTIACKVDSGIQISTIVKIREKLSTPIINPPENQTVMVNMSASFTCIAESIPKSSIEWHLGGSRLTGSVTTSSQSQRTVISTITYRAKKEHNYMYLYCSANNMFSTLNSSVVRLDILFVPTVYLDPEYDPYILYDGQINVKLKCSIDDANPLNGIKYHWTMPGGYAIGKNVIITTVSRSDGGRYRCIATNLVGNSSVSTKQIQVQYIPIITKMFALKIIEVKPFLDHTRPYSPPYVTAAENNSLHLQLTINANPTPTIEWTFRAEADWNIINFITIVSNTTTNSFLTSSSILIDDVQSNIFGEYTFAANNTVGTFFRRFVVMKEAYFTQVKCPIMKENTGMFVAGIVTLIVGLMSLTAAVFFVVRNGLKYKALNSSKSVAYSDVQRSNTAFTDANTTLQSNIESTVPLEQIINTYEECERTPEAHTYSSLDKIESEPSQTQQHGVNTYEECGKRIEAHAYDTLDK